MTTPKDIFFAPLQGFTDAAYRLAHHAICGGVAGIMIGRGLLARPTLTEEYQTGHTYSDDEVCERILTIHREVLSHYEQTLEGGDAQVLQKILPFWEYTGAAFDHRYIKRLKKSYNLQEYKSLTI